MNVFIHLTYEGEVDVDAITDTVMKNATIAQINNFGQTPSLIFNKPHPKKTVPDVARKTNDLIVIDQVALSWHSYISPPLSVVGATHYNLLAKVSFAPYTFAFTGSMKGIGDLKLLSRERIVCAPIGTKLIPPSCKKIVRVGGSSGGLSFIPLVRSLDSDKEVTLHENLHMKKITCISVSKSGDLIATGSEDTSVRVWQVGQFRSPLYTSGNTVSSRGRTLLHLGTMAGHVGPVKCIDINTVYNLVISGGSDRTVCIWDFRAVRLVRILGKHSGPVLSVSMGQHSGQLCTLTSSQLRVYSINGQMVACADMASPTTPSMSSMSPGRGASSSFPQTSPTCVLATPSADWQDGVVAVTGHAKGHVFLWRLRDKAPTKEKLGEKVEGTGSSGKPLRTLPSICRELYVCFTPTKTHKADITALRLSSIVQTTATAKAKELVNISYDDSRALDLLVGDAIGYVSRWTPLKLDQVPYADLQTMSIDNTAVQTFQHMSHLL